MPWSAPAPRGGSPRRPLALDTEDNCFRDPELPVLCTAVLLLPEIWLARTGWTWGPGAPWLVRGPSGRIGAAGAGSPRRLRRAGAPLTLRRANVIMAAPWALPATQPFAPTTPS